MTARRVSVGLVLVADRPLSSLDAELRAQMLAEVHELRRKFAATTIYFTRDPAKGMTMGNRIAVMRNGRLQQVDTPERLYERPVNQFVAGFIGSPNLNMVTAHVARTDG